MKRQENRAVIAWRGAASAGLVSSADRAYMKAPVPRPTLRLVDKVSRSCGYTPGKVTGQRVTVKAEMNGLTPGLDRFPQSKGNPVYVPLYHIAAKLVLINMGGDKLS